MIFILKFLFPSLFLSISLFFFQVAALESMNSRLQIPTYGSLEDRCGESNLLIRFCNPGREVLLLGDSHAEMYALALSDLYKTNNIPFADASLTGCSFLVDLEAGAPSNCRKRNDVVSSEIKTSNYKTLIYSEYFDDETDIIESLKTLKKYSRYFERILLIGPNPVWPDQNEFLNIGPFFRANYDPPKSLPVKYFSEVTLLETKIFAKLGDIDNVSFLSAKQVFCSNVECRRANSKGSWMYIDDNHLSIFGAIELVSQWKDTFILRY
jgi:hypothetical protein